ncbi:Gfo/Idh/MocA family protein [Lapidilactobacillus luobeiensis]|uniref:Gfo/Idh/MocA family protein n=1 Tax=Lapidilactobacillus luobeiensis TaxID=2950371 RepID=UPI0021C48F6B|nr:Gfo/Idh/MocA family oxidoreductase [Lapidilactobacillus luobeiensis]
MLKIGVIGLGNIAQKAYLPVMAGLQDQAQWILCTRDELKLNQLQRRYGFDQAVPTVAELLALQPDAVFIHTPTATHGNLIRQFLLAGSHVYVDKPVSTDLAEVQSLYALAQARGLLLTCGFNRRFASLNVQASSGARPTMVFAEKNRIATAQPIEFAIFDLFTHVIDTALFAAQIDSTALTTATRKFQIVADQQGTLQQAGMVLTTTTQTISAMLDMQAGVDQETLTLHRPSGISQVRDLQQLSLSTSAGTLTQNLPSWEPMLTARGFAPLIQAFLTAIVTPGTANPVSPTSSLLTHELCTELLASY